MSGSEREARPFGEVVVHFFARRSRSLAFLGIAAAVIPILISFALAIREGWMPVHDNSWQALQVKDVFSTSPPRLGAGSAATDIYAGTVANQPGPLSFFVLAPFYRFSGWAPWGLLLGAAVIKIACICGIALIARRMGGPLLVLWSMIFAAVMLWALRGEILHDIWNATIPMFPLALLLFASWWVSSGGLRSLPLVVIASSYIAQSHSSYLGLGVALGFWAVVGLGFTLRDDRRNNSIAHWRDRRRQALSWGAISIGVGALCWAPPLYDQVAEYGNLSRLAEANAVFDKIGLVGGTQRFLTTVTIPPFWIQKIDNVYTVIEPASQIQWLAAASAAAALGTLYIVMRHRKQRSTTRLIMTCAISLAAGAWTTAQGPVGVGDLHAFRWVWPVGMFLWFTLSWTTYEAFRPRLNALIQSLVVGVLAVAASCLLVLGTQQPDASIDVGAESFGIVSELTEQAVANLPSDGPYLVLYSGEAFWYVGPGMMANLERYGIDVRAIDKREIPFWGERRPYDGTNATGTIVITGGPQVKSAGTPEELIAFVPGGVPGHEDEPGFGFAVFLGPPLPF